MVQLEQYVVLKKTNRDLPKGHWAYIGLIDRSKSSEHWWTTKKEKLQVFDSIESAKKRISSLKYGPFKIIKLSEVNNYLNQEFWKVQKYRPIDLGNGNIVWEPRSNLSYLLSLKEHQFDMDGNDTSYEEAEYE